jgi:hypothetical protein
LVEGGLCRLGILPRLATGDQGIMGNFADSLLLGLIFVTTFVSIISLVQPITGGVQVVLSVIIFVCGGRSAIQAFRQSCRAVAPFHYRPLLLLLALYLIWAVIVASGAVQLYDTGTYHVQAVRWLKEYAAVPGLANLFGQLGYNSAWHVFCSLLDHGPFSHGRSYHVAGLLVFVYFLAFCLEGCQRLAAGHCSFSTFLRFFGFIAITYYYRDFIASLGTDMIAAVLAHYAVVRTIEVMEDSSTADRSLEHQRTLAFVTVVTVFAVTAKLSALPCLLFPCLIWLRCRRERIRLVWLCLPMAVCLALPFVARNYVLTGYVLYPQTQLDLFQCDWKVPADDVRVRKCGISEYAIGRDKDLNLTSMGVGAKVHAWFVSWGGERSVQWLLAWAVTGLGSCLPILWNRPKGSWWEWLGRWSVFGVILAGVMFCVVIAPEPRFLGVWGLALGYFPMAWLANSLANRFMPNKALCSSVTVAILFAFGLFLCTSGLLRRIILTIAHHPQPPAASSSIPVDDGPATGSGGFVGLLWTLRDLPEIALIKEQSTNGVVVNLPAESNKLWNAPLPATQRLQPWLQMRGTNLQDGFRVTHKSDWVCLLPGHCHQPAPQP